MFKASTIISTAKRYIGTVGGGTSGNQVIFNTAFYGNNEDTKSRPWCCAFIWYIFKEAGYSSLFYNGKATASCNNVADWAKNQHFFTEDANAGQPGDLILYHLVSGSSNQYNHIGVISERVKPFEYKVIEGNYIINGKHRVAEITRNNNRKEIKGIVHIPYNIKDSYIGGYIQQPTYYSISNYSNFLNISDLDNANIKSEVEEIQSQTSHKASYRQDIRQKIDIVNNYIKSNHDVTSYIKFSVNGFSLDTRDEDSFKHYAISLENKKTCVGQGNQFTLRIAYHKHFSNYENINRLEQALGPLRRTSTMSDSFGQIRDNKTKNLCTLEYGYLGVNNIRTPEYQGLLLKYSVKANKQIVEYTLEGFTGIVEKEENKKVFSWFPKLSIDDGKSSGNAISNIIEGVNNVRGEIDIEALTSEYIREFQSGMTINPYFALALFLNEYNNSLDDNSDRYIAIDCTGGRALNDFSTLQSVRMQVCKNQTVKSYIEYCISLFKYSDVKNYAIQYMIEKRKTSERFVFYYKRSKKQNNIVYVCIDVIDDNDTNNKVIYDFIGYTPDNNLLIDYDLNYDGTVALAIADNISNNENKQTRSLFINKQGAIRTQISLTGDLFGYDSKEILINKQNTWLDQVSVSNNCSITTFGLPFEIPVGSIFRCGIYITDTLHHTSGNCYVIEATDSISNSVFTTKFNMIRLPGKNDAITDN